MAKVTSKSKPAQQSVNTRPESVKNTVPDEEPIGRYINPLTDFGFKYIFGNKEFLIDFLNAVLKIEGGIVDLYYDNTERPGRSEDDRTTIFDLYCTLKNGERIIIEMQHYRHDNFVERTLYYATRLIQEQGEDKKGDTNWKFELKPVYSVNIVNFTLDTDKKKRKKTGKYISYAHIIDDDTHKMICDKLTFVYLELPYFTKEVHELTNYIDWWMYVLKNLAQLNHLPDALRNRIFERLFLKAEIAKLSKKDRKEYDRSLKKLRDMNIIVADRDGKIASLQQTNTSLQQTNTSLQQTNTSLQQTNTSLQQDNAAKDRRIAELERKLGLKA